MKNRYKSKLNQSKAGAQLRAKVAAMPEARGILRIKVAKVNDDGNWLLDPVSGEPLWEIEDRPFCELGIFVVEVGLATPEREGDESGEGLLDFDDDDDFFEPISQL